jgi:hypothetical protein
MLVYDYDAAKAHLRTRRCDPRAVAPVDLHTATLCWALIVLAAGFQTGLY